MSLGPAAVLVGVLATAAGPGTPSLAGQERNLRVAPALLRADGETTLGVRASYQRKLAGTTTFEAFPRTWSVGFGFDLPATLDPDRNPESLRVELRGGGVLSLFRPSLPDEGRRAWNAGYLYASGRVALEAPQELDRTDLLLGVVLAYEHERYREWWFLPEVRVAADRGFCLGCGLSAAASDDGDFSRFEGEAAWSVPLDRDWLPEALGPVWVRPGVRGFVNRGLSPSLQAQRGTEGVAGRVEVAYRLDDSSWLHEVFVRWSGGNVPVLRGDRRAWGAGVAVFF